MSRLSTKQFLMALFGTAFIGWIAGNMIFGSPGLSTEYLAKYKHEHEHYLEVVKNDHYKRYIQRPEIFDHSTVHDPHFQENIHFVEEYEENPELHAEEIRLERRGLFFDFFNAGLVVVLIARLAWPPLLRFLDQGAKTVAARIEELSLARKDAETRLRDAQGKLDSIPESRSRVNDEAEAALIRELNEMRERHHSRKEEVARENEDQMRDAVNAANRRLRRELFDRALRELEDDLVHALPERARDGLVDTFTKSLEGRHA